MTNHTSVTSRSVRLHRVEEGAAKCQNVFDCVGILHCAQLSTLQPHHAHSHSTKTSTPWKLQLAKPRACDTAAFMLSDSPQVLCIQPAKETMDTYIEDEQ